MMRVELCAVMILFAGAVLEGAVVKERLGVDLAGPNLLKPDAWEPWGEGFVRDGEMLVCDNGDDRVVHRGAGQSVMLNQKTPNPIIASAWSKAYDVSGSRNADYSIYLDMIYMDGQPKWGVFTSFETRTHDWERRDVIFAPDRPVAKVSCYVLMRRHDGKALFRNIELREVTAPEGVTIFDGVPVKVRTAPDAGFSVRDVAAGSHFEGLENGQALGVSVSYREEQHDGVRFIEAEVRDLRGEDRAITLVYTQRLSGGVSWQWCQDARRSVPLSGKRDYLETNRFQAGTGRLSTYPFGVVTSEKLGMAIGADPAFPAFCRFGANSGSGELFAAYDIGLAPEKPSAKIRLCVFEFDPEWGFRSALATYYRAFPEAFRRRVSSQGLWMPFAKISAVEGWEDFGFQFKEGNNETEWDDAHGITTFRYTEPMTWWMRMPKEMTRNYETALSLVHKYVAEEPESRNGMKARALLASGYHDANGRFSMLMRDTPWCDGAVWSMNSMPGIPGKMTDFRLKWGPPIKERLYGEARKGDLEGEYVDSSEGYVTEELDFRRDHFRASRTPLTFCPHTHRPAIFRGLIAFEYVKGIEKDIHSMGKLMMANSTPSRLWFLAPMLDVMGTETNWNRGDAWRPMQDRQMLYRRSLCATKPYCFLQNTAFEEFSHELVEKYMKRSLAYGMFPGFFSADASTGHYFKRPDLYNRDRTLFKSYVPFCKRIAEAGWQPITLATSSDPKVYVERFGEAFLTVFNDSDERCEAVITLSTAKWASASELIRKCPVGLTAANGAQQFTITLEAEDVALVQLELSRP